MTLSAALSVALSGLQVSTTMLQLTSNNIANATTAGYTAKQAIVSAVGLGSNVSGAAITGYTRSTNAALTTSLNNATSDASYSNTQNNYLQQIQTVLGSQSDNPPLSDAVAQFQSAWTQFSAAPENSAQQAAVMQAANTLTAQIRAVASGAVNLQKQVTTDTSTTVATLNKNLNSITALNQQIAIARGANQPTGDLEDARDTAINAIAAITSVTVMQRNNDQIALYTPGGTYLLDGTNAQNFSYNGKDVVSPTGTIVTDQLTGGSLQAELQFNADGSPAAASTLPGNEVIRKLNSQLTALTNAFTGTTGSPTTFASAYNSASTATGDLASNFFTVSVRLDKSGNPILDGAGNPIPIPSTMQLNANLINGTSTIKQSSGSTVLTALSANRSFTADGLSVPSGTYADLGTAVISVFQQAANTLKSQSDAAQQQQTYYQQSLSSSTGVNVDSELVQLTTLQNSYAASAHVISTINQMLQTLENVVG
jgi:flagellar hook-associated protein 1 FlgK